MIRGRQKEHSEATVFLGRSYKVAGGTMPGWLASGTEYLNLYRSDAGIRANVLAGPAAITSARRCRLLIPR